MRLSAVTRPPLHVYVVPASEPSAEVWHAASNREEGLHVAVCYRYRVTIEHDFRDDKSGGFDWESRHLVAPTQVDRLLLVLAVATLHTVSKGVFLVESGARSSMPAPDAASATFRSAAKPFSEPRRSDSDTSSAFCQGPGPDADPLTRCSLSFKVFNRFECLPGDTAPAGV